MLIQDFKQKLGKYEKKIRKKDFYDKYLSFIKSNNIRKVIDLGCASGDFLYHLPQDVQGLGIDTSKDLISVALETRKKENLDFHNLNILNDELPFEAELVVMTGFLCTFQDFKPAIEAAMSLSTKYILINDFLNFYGVDSRHSFRAPGYSQPNFETIYTIWSEETITSFLNKLNCKFTINDYKMDTNLEESTNPLFNFHSTLDGETVITNRGGIILNGVDILIEKL